MVVVIVAFSACFALVPAQQPPHARPESILATTAPNATARWSIVLQPAADSNGGGDVHVSNVCVVFGTASTDFGETFPLCVRVGECPGAALEATRAEMRRASRELSDGQWGDIVASCVGALERAGYEFVPERPRVALDGAWRGSVRPRRILFTVCCAVNSGAPATAGLDDNVCEFVAAAASGGAGAVVFYAIGGSEHALHARIAACAAIVAAHPITITVHAFASGSSEQEAYAACAQAHGPSTVWMTYLNVRERLVGGAGGASALGALAAEGVGAVLLCVVQATAVAAGATLPIVCNAAELRSIVRPEHAAVRSTRLPCLRAGVGIVDATFSPSAWVHACNCAATEAFCPIPRRVLDGELVHVVSADMRSGASAAARSHSVVAGAAWRVRSIGQRSARLAVAMMLFGDDVAWVLERAAFTIASLRARCALEIVVFVPSKSWAARAAATAAVSWNLTVENHVLLRVADFVQATDCASRGAKRATVDSVEASGEARYGSSSFWSSTHMLLASLLLTEYDAVAFIDALDVLVERSLEPALRAFAVDASLDCAAAPDHNRGCSERPYINAGLVFLKPSRWTYVSTMRSRVALCMYGVQDTVNEALVAPAAAAGRFGCLPSEVHCMPAGGRCTNGALVHFIGPVKPWSRTAEQAPRSRPGERWDARDWRLHFAEARYGARLAAWAASGGSASVKQARHWGRTAGPFRLGSASDFYAAAMDAVVLQVVPVPVDVDMVAHVFTCVVVATRYANGTSAGVCTAPKCFAVRARAPWPLMITGMTSSAIYDVVLFFDESPASTAGTEALEAGSGGDALCDHVRWLIQHGADSTAIRMGEASGRSPRPVGAPPIVTFVDVAGRSFAPAAVESDGDGCCSSNTQQSARTPPRSMRELFVLLSLGSEVHLSMVRPVAEALHEGLVYLGRNATLLECAALSDCRPGVEYPPSAQVIVVGTCGLALDPIAMPAVLQANGSALLPRSAILYNLEMLNVPASAPFQCVHAAFVALLQAYAVWEFAPYNFVQLPKFGVSAAEFVPFSYARALSARWPPPLHVESGSIASGAVDRDIPVLFFGSECARRHRFLATIVSDAGVLPMWHNAYGTKLEVLVRRAAVVLVVRQYDTAGYPTMSRVAPLLASETFIVSEQLDDDSWLQDGDGVVFVDDAGDAAAAILFYLRRPDLRLSIARKGRAAIEARPQWELLEGPLRRLGHPG